MYKVQQNKEDGDYSKRRRREGREMRAALFSILEPKAMATATRSQEGLESRPQIATGHGSDYRGVYVKRRCQ